MPKTNKNSEEEIRYQLSPLEWGLVITVVLVATVAVVLSVDPNRRLNEATNARRFSDVTAILDDIKDYQKANEALPAAMLDLTPGLAYEIGQCETEAVCTEVPVQDQCVDLSELGEMLLDPSIGTLEHSAYYVIAHEEDEVTVGACQPDPEMALGEGAIPAINLRD